ncbi:MULTISPECIES: hypothetical protein [Bradyrhizobium]|uniref:hypothetical protein n=1 Tax=Bradyrhizobium TaxID=374 RepID=UPI0002D66C4E|nr:hypothetical protein [Bradyrhizobium japonicum]KMJ93507.1 hypothetical protein CF64_42645 [Bradyrhizobium japonicum]MCS3537339.1 hypothetical protein [Bradyrhizobium japonicum]MCS3986572.1 hypothetical protein [Bradyrhizobium japonicum]MCS4018613.1 hypothetical protein [Bradyrhizobium japonicum]MCS4205718.1 hypothetical protein [Bradyrhizobium japonicum]
MTIENLASFNRHVAEADAARLGATLYVGGYPSLASQQALRTISAMVSEQTPIFHICANSLEPNAKDAD